MITLLAIGVALAATWRWPGVAIPAVYFCYVSEALSGMSNVTLMFTAAAGAILALRVMRSGLVLRLTALDLAFVMFATWHAGSAAYMRDGGMASAASLQFLMASVSVYLLARLIGMSGRPAERLAEICFGFCLIGCVAALDVLASATLRNSRLYVGEATPVGLSQPFPLMFIAGVGLLLMARTLAGRTALIGGAAIALSLYVSMLSGTRGNLLAIAAGVALIALYAIRPGSGGVPRLVFLGAGGLAALLAAGPDLLATDSIQRFLNFDNYGATTDISSAVRWTLYDAAFRMIDESSVIGHGIGSFHYFTGGAYPHNLFLEAWAESGLVGVALLVIYLLVAMRTIRTTGISRMGWTGVAFVAMLFAGLVHHQVSFQIGAGKSLFLAGLLAGVAALPARLRAPPLDPAAARPAITAAPGPA